MARASAGREGDLPARLAAGIDKRGCGCDQARLGRDRDLPADALLAPSADLTEMGQELARCARAIVGEWENFEQQADGLKGFTRGKLKVAVVSTAKYFIPRLLVLMRMICPPSKSFHGGRLVLRGPYA